MRDTHSREMNGKRLGERPDSRPTIGLLTRGISDEFSGPVWKGVADVARERDVNLVGFVGGMLGSPHGFEAQGNILYNLAGAGNVDGLLIWTGILGHYVGPEEMQNFCKRFSPLPVVSIELPMEGIPSVLGDFQQSMHDIVVHLIEVHGYRRIAFIRGPEDSLTGEERYRAYTAALAEHGIPFDPDLIAPGDFFAPSGAKAMHLLLDERGVNFEAVIAANDNMALDAARALQVRGLRVPDDIAVVGVDDIEEASCVTPPLTTARVPFYEWGRRGAELLLAQLLGEEVPEIERVPLELVVRQSCGCLSSEVMQAATSPDITIPAQSSIEQGLSTPTAGSSARETFEAGMVARRQEILSEIIHTLGISAADIASKWAEQILDAFVAEVTGEFPGTFVRVLDKVLRQVAMADGNVRAWQAVLSVLRRHTLPYLFENGLLSQAENLWGQARVMVGEIAERVQIYQGLQIQQEAATLRDIGQTLITAFDRRELMDILATELPRLGIRSLYLSQYEKPGAMSEWSRLILAYDEGMRVELKSNGRRFPSRQLVPDALLPRDRQYSIVVEPLYFRENQLGFAVFEASPQEERLCDSLRGMISSALQGALLVQQVENRALQVQTAAEVSRAASSILDPDDLTTQIVNLARKRFDLYYAGLFLVDTAGEWTGESDKWAVLRAGTGEAGRQMLEAGHKLEVGGESMIGWCVANQKARIALDVGEEAVHFQNPWLPETRSELALPLISRGQVIGAMTIQSSHEAAFSKEDISTLQTMADQLANAIGNAHLYDQAQKEIAERKRAEEALRASEQRFALAVRGTNDGIWDWDIQNETLYWSPRLKELLGYAEDELDVDFDTFNSLMHPDDQERTGAAIETHLRDRSPYDVEQRLRAKSGEYRWFHVRGQAIWDEAGQPLRMVGFTTDITERKQTEAERERLLAALEHRNSQLQTAAAVSRAAASILDPDQLIQRVVDLVRTRFQLYYAGLFLVDREGKWSGEPGRWALLRAGTGEAGRQMLEAGHKLAVGGTSMIGWCTANAQARIALDVGEEAAHFQNPWLPETRSELALPLISRGQVIGAMTIQSTQEAAFSEEDVAVLQTMADQLAAAIENARLLEETRSALAQVEATHRLYLQREWREYLDDRESLWQSGLLYDRVQVAAEPDLWRPEMERALAEGQVVTADNNGANGKRTGLAVPIVLRGETIGVLGLEDPDGMRQWSDEDRDLMAAFSQQLALALENARLLEETQRRAARERLTGEISARMRETLDVDTVLETAIREIGQALNIAEIEVRMESGERAPQSENDHEQVA
jgi:PAS domain S-box-containing protein